jgi:hypothetical protein
LNYYFYTLFLFLFCHYQQLEYYKANLIFIFVLLI